MNAFPFVICCILACATGSCLSNYGPAITFGLLFFLMLTDAVCDALRRQ